MVVGFAAGTEGRHKYSTVLYLHMVLKIRQLHMLHALMSNDLSIVLVVVRMKLNDLNDLGSL
jgi:hypothetical protein